MKGHRLEMRGENAAPINKTQQVRCKTALQCRDFLGGKLSHCGFKKKKESEKE